MPLRSGTVFREAGEASGELWSVHGGGFYHNQKYQVAPSAMPDELHWFKWEAYFTWISGFSLLVLIYYVGAQSFLIDPAKATLSPVAAIAIGLASLAGNPRDAGLSFITVAGYSPIGHEYNNPQESTSTTRSISCSSSWS